MTTAITTKNYRDFFAAFGVTEPIDLFKTENAAWQLRERIEGLTPQLVENPTTSIGIGHIRPDQLRIGEAADNPVFQELARYDEEPRDLSFFELARGLEKAELLRTPLGENAASLWHSPDSIRWDVLRHSRQTELGNYLEYRGDDNARFNALNILEAWAQKSPSDFEGTFAFDGRIVEIILASNDPKIRERFLRLFQTSSEITGRTPLEGFENLERDFVGILTRLQSMDLGVVRELLRDQNPRKVTFALLCAKRLLSETQFRAVCRNLLAERPVLAEKIVFSRVTFGTLLQALAQSEKPPLRLAAGDL